MGGMGGRMNPSNLPVDQLSPIVKAYQLLGYKVTADPADKYLPDFLKRFRPDLIASKPGENLIVQLRRRVPERSLSYWRN